MVTTDLYSSLIYNLIITAFYWSWVAFEIWLISRDRGTVKNESEDRGSRNTIFFGGVLEHTRNICNTKSLAETYNSR